MTEPTPVDPAVTPADSTPATDAVPADTQVVEAPALVTDPAAPAPVEPAPVDSAPVASTPVADNPTGPGTDSGVLGGSLGDHQVDTPVVPSTTDTGTAGYQTVGDHSAVVDNAALQAQHDEASSVSPTGHIVRGGVQDDSQGTPAGLDVATPDNVRTDGGPTVFTDEEITRLEDLNLEVFEKTVEDRLATFEEDQSNLESLRGRHSSDAVVSDSSPASSGIVSDTSPQTDTSGNGSTSA